MTLDALKAAVDRGRRAQLAPPPPGEVRAWQSIEESFSDDDWMELHRVVREIARRAPETFARFFGEVRPARWVVDALCDEPGVPTIDWLVERLEARARDEGPWLVATPLAHVEVTDRYAALADSVALVEVEQRHDIDNEEPVTTVLDQWRHLRDRLHPPSRWLPRTRLNEFPVDTGCRSALISVEHGTEGAAANRARTHALLALAVWTLFEAPAWRRVWPSVADWMPQPWIERSGRHKPYEPDLWTGATAPRSAITYYGPYRPPADPALLALPFRAMANLDRRSVQVLLSAAWSLFHSRRFPSLLEATDRAFYLSTALAALCEPPTGGSGSVLARWRRVRDRLRVRDELRARGYTDAELDVAEQRSYAVRNISAHGGDAVLVNLGYPTNAVRSFRGSPDMSGSELAISVLNLDRRPMLWALCEAVRHLLLDGDEHEWDDNRFERHFAP